MSLSRAFPVVALLALSAAACESGSTKSSTTNNIKSVDECNDPETSGCLVASEQMIGSLTPYDVSLSLPKFHIESSFDLADALVKLGMTDAFSGAADFSGISKQSQLHISAVLHKAFVDVDENGTEAAAATAVVLGDGGIPEHAEIHLDHPFLVMIRDQPTGSILFFGRVADPQG